ncbi:hypothetical protein SLA2020_414610 [Shorea laevis]
MPSPPTTIVSAITKGSVLQSTVPQAPHYGRWKILIEAPDLGLLADHLRGNAIVDHAWHGLLGDNPIRICW